MLRYRLVMLIISITAGYLSAAPGDKHTFELKWQERGTSDTIQVPLDRQEPFAAEPDLGQRQVLRGVLQCMGQDKNEYRVNFIMDKTEDKLYVDLNRDGNLTNDPNGILQAQKQHSDYYNFPPFLLTFVTEEGKFNYQLSANYWDNRWRQELTLQIESDYEGKIELYGNQWFIRVNDKLKGQIKQDSRFSLGPAMTPALGSMPPGYETNDISYLRIPKNLFFDGHCYSVDFEFRKSDSGDSALWCTLTEKEVPTQMLHIQSKSVSRLVFGNDQMLVLPPLVDRPISVPAGDFRVQACFLSRGKDQSEIPPQRFDNIIVKVAQEGENIFKIGAPLQSSVRVERTGNILKFHYELKGAGGEKYDVQQVTNYDNKKQPTVAIYKGDMKLAEGQFEFG